MNVKSQETQDEFLKMSVMFTGTERVPIHSSEGRAQKKVSGHLRTSVGTRIDEEEKEQVGEF